MSDDDVDPVESVENAGWRTRSEVEVRNGYAFLDFRPEQNPAQAESKDIPGYKIKRIDDGEGYSGEFPEMDFRELSQIGNTDHLTHAIHKHPAIFIPQIPNYLIEEFSDEIAADGKRPTVLDPFSGSGSVGIEAKVSGRDYLGVEINPLSKLVSEVATTPLPPSALDAAAEWIITRLNQMDNKVYNEYDVDFPGKTKKSHWFTDSAIKGLTQIRKAVTEFRRESPVSISSLTDQERSIWSDLSKSEESLNQEMDRWLVLMIANTVFEVSNADPGVSKAYKSPKMKRKIREGTHPPNVVDKAFTDNITESKQKLRDLWMAIYGEDETADTEIADNPRHKAKVDIRLNDARSFDFPEYKNSIELAITSPPYINAINYYRGTKLRLFWIRDLIEDDLDPSQLRQSIVGSNTSGLVDADVDLPLSIRDLWKGSKEEFENTTLPQLDQDIEEIHQGELAEARSRGYVVWKFFAKSMISSLSRVYEHLKPGGYFFFVVGENVIGNRRIRSHEFIADIAENLGKFETSDENLSSSDRYHHIGMCFDEISNRDLFRGRAHGSGSIEREWIVILQKPIDS